MPRIRHLAGAIGPWLLILLFTLLAVRDRSEPQPQALILFLGQGPPELDRSYARFVQAMQRLRMPVPLRLERATLAADEARDRQLHKLLARRPAVLVAPTFNLAMAVSRANPDTPLVFASFLDPVRMGLVHSLRQPGRARTGVSLADDLHLKRLEILHDAFPRVRRVAVLADDSWLNAEGGGHELRRRAAAMSLDLLLPIANTEQQLQQLLRQPPRVDAWYIPPTFIAYLGEARLAAHFRQARIPAMYTTEREMELGGTLAYIQDHGFAFDALAKLAARVATGEDAGSIPVERPYRMRLCLRRERGEPGLRPSAQVARRADCFY